MGRPKLCFGKSTFPFHLSSVYVTESHETSPDDDMGNMLPGEFWVVFRLQASNRSDAVVKFVQFSFFFKWIGLVTGKPIDESHVQNNWLNI